MKSYSMILMLLGCFVLSAFTGEKQVTTTIENEEVQLSKVFRLGDNNKEAEALSMEHNTRLLSVCKGDMDKAFQKWVGMMLAIEKTAKDESYDINGVKFWIKVFWNKDGSIRNIGYYLKPNSRLVNEDQLAAFLTIFADKYVLPLQSDVKFSHYASASFPLHQYRKKAGE